MTEIMKEQLAYRSGETAFVGTYVHAKTPAASARSGILIAPDWRGVSPSAIEQAERLARKGHDVVVADLYGDGLYSTDEAKAHALIAGLLENRKGLTARMSACRAAFGERLPASAPVIALGYSIGGMASLDLARSGASLAGVVLCSALLKTAETGAPTKIAAPVLVLHGTRDVVCPMDQVALLTHEMDEADNDLRVVLYGATGHAFYNPAAGTDPKARLCYSADADRRSTSEIDAFVSGPAT